MKLLFYSILFVVRVADTEVGERGTRPNFLLVLFDDAGFGDLGCYAANSSTWDGKGSPTPFIDSLAERGMSFLNYYAPAPFCTPSRAAMLTGRFGQRTGVNGLFMPVSNIGLPPDELTIATLLRRAGYRTAIAGKWHLGHVPPFLPAPFHGFDSWLGLPYSNDMGCVDEPIGFGPQDPCPAVPSGAVLPLYHVDPSLDCKDRVSCEQGIVEQPTDLWKLSDRLSDFTVSFLRTNSTRPFFMYLALTQPHVPLTPPSLREETSGKKKRTQTRTGPGTEYFEAMRDGDSMVRRAINALRETGQEEQTLTFITSDNGPALSFGPFGGSPGPFRGGEFSTLEGGSRVFAVAYWPGNLFWNGKSEEGHSLRHGRGGEVGPSTSHGDKGRRRLKGNILLEHLSTEGQTRAVASGVDLLPTFLSLAGIPLPKDRHFDGLDMSGVLLRGEQQLHAMLWGQGHRLHGAMAWLRLGHYKIYDVHSARSANEFSILDLDHDPKETNPLPKEISITIPSVIEPSAKRRSYSEPSVQVDREALIATAKELIAMLYKTFPAAFRKKQNRKKVNDKKMRICCPRANNSKGCRCPLQM